MFSLERNSISGAAVQAFVQAIITNETTHLSSIAGIHLGSHLHALGLSDEFLRKGNSAILAHIRQRRPASMVKSARGGAR
jgi:hypothetical protein